MIPGNASTSYDAYKVESGKEQLSGFVFVVGRLIEDLFEGEGHEQ